jgi:hypothetical protein
VKILSQDKRIPDRDLNTRPAEYKAGQWRPEHFTRQIHFIRYNLQISIVALISKKGVQL